MTSQEDQTYLELQTPHMYINSEGKRKNPEVYSRLKELKTSILHSVERIHNEQNNDLVEIQWLFFDEI